MTKKKKRPQKRILSRKTNFLLRFGAFSILLVIVLGRGCLFRPKSSEPGSHYNKGRNAAWLSVEWVSQPHTITEIVNLVDDLAQRQITTVYIFTTSYKADGSFNATYGYAQEFVSAIKGVNPDLSVQAWVGLPYEYINLNNTPLRHEVVDFCVTLVDEGGFDGLHLDVEPVKDRDKAFIKLLEDVREALGEERTLSIAGRRIWPIFPTIRWPLVGQWSWSASYYQKIARRVDEIAVLNYDSALPVGAMYRQWTKFEVIALTRTLVNTEARVYVGVPTLEEITGTHKPKAENMRTGLQGIVNGLNDWASWSKVVTGVAIYPYWETGDVEWQTYQKLWLGE